MFTSWSPGLTRTRTSSTGSCFFSLLQPGAETSWRRRPNTRTEDPTKTSTHTGRLPFSLSELPSSAECVFCVCTWQWGDDNLAERRPTCRRSSDKIWSVCVCVLFARARVSRSQCTTQGTKRRQPIAERDVTFRAASDAGSLMANLLLRARPLSALS